MSRASAQNLVTVGANGFESMIRLADRAREAMRLDEARRAYEQVLKLRPDNLDAQIGLMRCHFYAENWVEAWKAFEVRFRRMDRPPQVTGRDASGKPFVKPRWTGGPAPKSLLILDEQGMGDSIQFIRFLPRLAAGTRMILVTHRRLFGLIRTMGLDIELRPMDEAGTVAGVDAWTPLLSLPMALGAGAADLAMRQSYLKADPTRIERWRAGLAVSSFKVGIAWQGNPKAPVDANRSAPLSALAPLAAIPGVQLISLQRDAGAEQLGSAAFDARVIRMPSDFDAGPDAFLDTAALMMSLDLVVTVDTAVAHLAGALGRPAAVALSAHDADWRWIPGRGRSPWYPSLRLFRQPERGDWFGAFAQIAEEIRVALRRRDERKTPRAPVSIGELLDKITILTIKNEKLPPGAKRDNVRKELSALMESWKALGLTGGRIGQLEKALRLVNEQLWTIEDDIRACESEKDFGDKFISLARAVYITNDRRALLKSQVNDLSGSVLREEKSYHSST
jgi:hypothetical protein